MSEASIRMTPEILTVTQAGAILGKSKPEAHRLASLGVIPTFENPTLYKGRRVLRSKLDELIQRIASGEDVTAMTTTLTTTRTRPVKTAQDSKRGEKVQRLA